MDTTHCCIPFFGIFRYPKVAFVDGTWCCCCCCCRCCRVFLQFLQQDRQHIGTNITCHIIHLFPQPCNGMLFQLLHGSEMAKITTLQNHTEPYTYTYIKRGQEHNARSVMLGPKIKGNRRLASIQQNALHPSNRMLCIHPTPNIHKTQNFHFDLRILDQLHQFNALYQFMFDRDGGITITIITVIVTIFFFAPLFAFFWCHIVTSQDTNLINHLMG